ncbi:MAG: hypothetical protein WC476_01695 [Phycisphaerae bacterium]|jgi:hypothetical protein
MTRKDRFIVKTEHLGMTHQKTFDNQNDAHIYAEKLAKEHHGDDINVYKITWEATYQKLHIIKEVGKCQCVTFGSKELLTGGRKN